MSSEFEADYNALVAHVMALPEAVRSVKLLSTEKAALFLNLSISTLEKRRKKHEPPPPAPNYQGGRKGDDVKYLAGTLVEFIRGLPITQPNPYPETVHSALAVNAEVVRRNALATTGARRHLMKYGDGLGLEDEDASMPFFVSQDGLVLAPCWDEQQQTVELFLADSTEVVWMPWANAMASVWHNESDRQGWMATSDKLAPGLRQRVDAMRLALLSKI